MSAKAPQNRQTGGAYTDGDSKAYREAFTEEVCDALYLKAPRLVKRLQRVPTRDVRLAGRACKYSAVLMRGVYPWDPTKPCQDSFFVNESMVVDGLASHWFAVMDGHGPDGDGCAHFIRDNLEKVARKLHGESASSASLEFCTTLAFVEYVPMAIRSLCRYRPTMLYLRRLHRMALSNIVDAAFALAAIDD